MEIFLFRAAWRLVARSLHREQNGKIYYSTGSGFLCGLRGEARDGASVLVISVALVTVDYVATTYVTVRGRNK